MANVEHLARLKQGVDIWNAWRAASRTISPEISRVTLREAYLEMAHLASANLTGAHLCGADLYRANLVEANFTEADLTGANLSGADLTAANFSDTNLTKADLTATNLTEAHLCRAHLCGADLGGASLGWTTFGSIDLSTVRRLETVRHAGPSTIGIDTLYLSHGNIPEAFLRGAGVPDEIITYAKSLVGRPFEHHSCFISYSGKDTGLAERLCANLQATGVRCWYAPEDMKIGDKFRSRIDEAIHLHDKLPLILSKHSLESPWVEKEVETAFAKEGKENRLVLFPVRVDQAILQRDTGWAADIHRTRHIGGFRRWKHHDAYKKSFDRLLRDLKAASQ